MLTHEFVHLALPELADEHDWLQEGAATYVEPVARARAGQLSAERVWSEFVLEMPRGLPGAKDHGLDSQSSWARTYWGGALFCLVADVEIRKRSDNRFGLQDALRAILEDGGTLDHHWSIRDALRSGDRATGVAVLTELYEQWRATPVQVDLDALWRDLGVVQNGRHASLNDAAPLAAIRRAITGQEDILLVAE
jgi:predicted metalloprotease with PDZ domain